MPPESTKPLDLFYSYSHKDEDLRDQLEEHLAMLKREGIIKNWHDRRISGGREWEGQIDQHLNSADIILLLASSSFLASDYCFDVELSRAMERQEAGEARVIPVILRACDWHTAPFGKLQALPKDGKPIKQWPDPDVAFLDVANGIRRAAYEVRAAKTARATAESEPIRPDPYTLIPDLRVDFVQRTDSNGKGIVQLLQSELSPQRPRLVALWGAGGVGKTAIAAETVRGLIQSFEKRVVWVSADGLESFSLTTLLDEIATQLGQPDLRKLSVDLKKEQVRDLARMAPALVILDNFETIEATERGRCVEWLGKPAPCSAVITTRDKIEEARNIPIEAMLPEEANALLDQLIGQAHDTKAFAKLDRDRLIDTAEGNPLVLQWIVGQIDLAQDPKEVLDDLHQGQGSAAERVFNRSFELKQLDNGGRAVLLALSLFAPSATRKAVAEVSGLRKDSERKKFKDAIKSLAALWLIHTTDESQRLAVGGLTRELTRARLNADPRAKPFRQRFALRFLHHTKAYSEVTSEHFAALQSEKENLVNAMDVAFQIGDWMTVAEITYRAALFLDLRGYWDEALRLCKQALIAAEKSGNRYQIGVFADRMGDIFQNRSQYAEAMVNLKRARAIAEELHAEQGLAATLNKIARIELHIGNPEEARRLLTEALDIETKLNDLKGAAVSRSSLAVIAVARGEIEDARQLERQSFNLIKTLHDENSLAASFSLRALIEYCQGNIDEANELYQESMIVSERLGDQSAIARLNVGLAELAFDQGHFHEAHQLYRRAMDINKNLGSEEGVAAALRGLGRLKREEGKLIEARKLYDQSLAIERRIDSASGQAVSLFLLGELNLDESKYDDADMCLTDALAIFRKLKQVWGMAESLRAVGNVRAEKDLVSEARIAYDEALALANPPGFKLPIAKVLYSQGLLAERERNVERARELMLGSLRIFEKLRSPLAEECQVALKRLEGIAPTVDVIERS